MHMKRIFALFLSLVCIVLCACSDAGDALARPMALRAKLLQSTCHFTAEITADYGDEMYTFSMDCTADAAGDHIFTVLAPEAIEGITGSITGEGGSLTFDGVALGFSLLADGQVTPVSAPWLLIKSLRAGFLRSAGEDGDGLRVSVNDSYADDALTLDVWLDGENLPIGAVIYYGGRSILSLRVKDFTLL